MTAGCDSCRTARREYTRRADRIGGSNGFYSPAQLAVLLRPPPGDFVDEFDVRTWRIVMMMRVVTSLAIAAALVAPALAQTGKSNMEILSQKIKADKKLVVAANLKLTDAEGAKFWPVYEAYQKELQGINERFTAVILAYADAYNKGAVDDATAKKLIEDASAVDDAEATLRRTTLP